MDQQTLLIVLTIFVALAALAMLIQMGMLIGLFLIARELRTKFLAVLPEVQSIIGITKRTTEKVEGHVDQIGKASLSILDTTKQQLVKVDDLLGDATTRAKVQMERAEMVLDDTMGRVQQTVSVVQAGVLRPVREVHGILAGIRATLTHLGRGGRPTVDHATSDEEMFI
jgi:hypothetical protein